MKTGTVKKQIAFRVNVNLLDRLKEQAKQANRSLSNYIECILMDNVYMEPNETTISAINEARSTERGEVFESVEKLMIELNK